MKADLLRHYLAKRADLVTWPLVSGPREGIDQIVVIPALAERDHLFATLDSLAANPARELARTLVVCVVNNRAVPLASPADIENNRETLARLDGLVRGAGSGLRVAYVDASSPGRELPEKDGVGLARKIGMDWGLAVLSESLVPCRLLLSLDADTLVAPNYIEAVRAHFERTSAWAAVVAYAHRLDSAPEEVEAIIGYELFLRYHALGLAWAGSPYAFHTIGSTMVCRAEAYAAVAGMNRRQAGEDFYFLQQLAKTGRVDSIATTTVYPSCRRSNRVPFGTGPRVQQFQDRGEAAFLVYHPDSYRVLKAWLELVAARLDAEAAPILQEAGAIAPELKAFLEASQFAPVWARLRQNSRDAQGFHDQFHRWFDGLKTLRLIHHLRGHGLPEQDVLTALEALFVLRGVALPGEALPAVATGPERRREALEYLRHQAS